MLAIFGCAAHLTVTLSVLAGSAWFDLPMRWWLPVILTCLLTPVGLLWLFAGMPAEAGML